MKDIEATAIQALLAGQLDAHAKEIDFQDSNGRSGVCRLRHLHVGDTTVLICSELAGNRGPSITNAAPAPWQAAEDEIELRGQVVWLEHYGPESDGRDENTIDRVTVSGRDMPAWQHLHRVAATKAAA